MLKVADNSVSIYAPPALRQVIVFPFKSILATTVRVQTVHNDCIGVEWLFIAVN